jgi:hypothetical protein
MRFTLVSELVAGRGRLVTAEDLAGRLRHGGIAVVDADDSDMGPRAYLANGLTVEHRYGEYHVVYWHGSDPVTGEIEVELATTTNAFAVPDLVRKHAPEVPALERALRAEERDWFARVWRAVAEYKDGPEVVASQEPVPGAFAVSLRGKRFTGWLNGTRITSMMELGWLLSTCWFERVAPPPLLPMNANGHHLTVLAQGIAGAVVNGTVATSEGDAWFQRGYNRCGKWWSPRSRMHSIGSATLAPADRDAIEKAVRDELARTFEREFATFAAADVARLDQEVRWAHDDALRAPDREWRLRCLRRERVALRRLGEARKTLARGCLVESEELELDGLALF